MLCMESIQLFHFFKKIKKNLTFLIWSDCTLQGVNSSLQLRIKSAVQGTKLEMVKNGKLHWQTRLFPHLKDKKPVFLVHDHRLVENDSKKYKIQNDDDAAPTQISSSTIRDFLTVLALSFHATFEGLAIGLESSVDNVWTMFAGTTKEYALNCIWILKFIEKHRVLKIAKKREVILLLLNKRVFFKKLRIYWNKI